MKYYDGATYKGWWKNDEYEGYGVLKEVDGKVFKGIWKNGELVKWKK
jgi:hypothetical protein